MKLKVTPTSVEAIEQEEIFSGSFKRYILKLDLAEELKKLICKIQITSEFSKDAFSEIVYLDDTDNYLPVFNDKGGYAIKIVFYELVEDELITRYSLPIYYFWVKKRIIFWRNRKNRRCTRIY